MSLVHTSCALRAPSTGAQSNIYICEHTENPIPTKIACDVSSLAASSAPTVLGAPTSTVLVPESVALLVVLRRLRWGSLVSRSLLSSTDLIEV